MLAGAVVAQPLFDESTWRLNQPPTGIQLVDAGSAVDFNQDGLIDVFSFGRLYVNQGGGFFEEKRQRVGLEAVTERKAGSVWGDFDNDGLLDAALLSRSTAVTLYHNRGNERMEQIEGLLPTDAVIGESGFWADLDNNGWLDLLVGGVSEVAIYWNQEGTGFEETRQTFNTIFAFCAASGADYDRDDDIDVFLGTCQKQPGSVFQTPNVLLRNEGNQVFVDVAGEVGVLDQYLGYDTEGGIWFDQNNDGWQDLLIVRNGVQRFRGPEGGPVLYQNDQQGRFINVTRAAGLDTLQTIRFSGGIAGDFDNDGWADVVLSKPFGPGPDAYLQNKGDGTFALPDVGLTLMRSSAAAVADFDNNGWLDLWANSWQDQLFLNQPQTAHWLQIQLTGVASNRFGIGARVVVYAGAQAVIREIQAGQSGGSQHNSLTAHVGLGEAVEADSIVVQWPSGQVDRAFGVTADQRLTMVEGHGVNPRPKIQLGGPVDDERLDTEAAEVHFSWGAIDANQDRLVYTFFLRGADVDTVIAPLKQAEVRLPSSLFQEGGRFEWSVQATDGFSVAQSEVVSFLVFSGRAPFLNLIRFPLSALDRGDIALGDWDGDRDLDYAVTGWKTNGEALTALYALEDTTFVEVNGELEKTRFTKQYKLAATAPGVAEGGIEWVDINRDGIFELFMHGLTGTVDDPQPFAALYQNLGGQFGAIQLFEGVFHSHVAWGDFDGDGDMDVVLSGATTQDPLGRPITRLYRNRGVEFEEVTTNLPGFMHGSAAWGDYDSDGQLDLVMMGDMGHGHLGTRLYRGTGHGQFEEVATTLPEWAFGSVAWADYDGDGDLDLLQTGGELDAAQLMRGGTRLYRNDDGHFSDTQQVFSSAYLGEARWADYDADGDPDVIVHGSESVFGERTALVFLNQNGLFVPDTGTRSVGGLNAKVQAGDYNNDGDLDLIFLGQGEDNRATLNFYINCQFPEYILPDLLGEGASGTIKACSQ